MAKDVVIKVEGLGKCYSITRQKDEYNSTFREDLVRSTKNAKERLGQLLRGKVLRPKTEPETFWALKNIEFDVREGEVLGVVGRNGAGKSTLLKILSRITEPTTGRVEIYGRVATLLEVGTGFHPELSGRENVFLNGSLLGMRRSEIQKRFDEIVSFSGVGQFIDTPVKRFSSGMYVRLAFSVAAHLEPDILIVDEVLAVGDAEFQKRCLGKISDVAACGRTVLFVSHNLPLLRNICTRAVLLSEGCLKSSGSVADTIANYQKVSLEAASISLLERQDRKGDGRLRFSRVKFIVNGENQTTVPMGEPFEIVLEFVAIEDFPYVNFSIHVVNDCGDTVLRLSTIETARPQKIIAGAGTVSCSMPSLTLLPGEYRIIVAASIPTSFEHVDHVEDAAKFTVTESDVYGTGRIPTFGVFYTVCNWRIN